MLANALTLRDPTRPWEWPWVELLRLRRLQWTAHTITLPHLPAAMEGLRIVHLTDLHIDTTWMPAWDRVIERLNNRPPDLIVITGDFIDRKQDYRPALPLLNRFLGSLHARLGVWGMFGNHDGDTLGIPLNDSNVRLLYNESACLRDGDATLEIIGIHGVMPNDLSPRVLRKIGPKPPGCVRLTMAHYPHQVLTLRPIEPDIVFAGHTHGGQVCLPGGIPIQTHDPLPKRFARGVHRIDETWLSVGRGLGFSTHPIRTFCPAEVIELTLTRKA